MKRTLVLILFLLLIILCTACSSGTVEANFKNTMADASTLSPDSITDLVRNLDDYYAITKCDSYYLLTLYDHDKNEVYQSEYPIKPSIDVADENIISIFLGCGTSCSYTEYYNIETGQISDPYFLVYWAEYGLVVYPADDKLIVRDMFDQSVFYKEIISDYTLAPFGTIHDAVLLNQKQLKVYFVDEDNSEYSDIIDLY